MSNAWKITKCLGIFLLSILLGMVFSILGMLFVVAVNSWDDAPGGGLFILFAIAVGVATGVLCGGLCCSKLWRHRSHEGQAAVFKTFKGAIGILTGCSLLPAVLILPLSGPHEHLRVVLSMLAAMVLAAIAGWLIYGGAKRLTADGTVAHV